MSGVVSGVKLKVRPNQSISMPTSPWVPFISVAGTQVPTQLAMALLVLVCPSAPGTSPPACCLPVAGMYEDQSTACRSQASLPLPHCRCSSLHEISGVGGGGRLCCRRMRGCGKTLREPPNLEWRRWEVALNCLNRGNTTRCLRSVPSRQLLGLHLTSWRPSACPRLLGLRPPSSLLSAFPRPLLCLVAGVEKEGKEGGGKGDL